MMKNIVFDFLAESDRLTGTYIKAIPLLQQNEVISCHDENVVYDHLDHINTGEQSLILTFLGHGNVLGLGRTAGEQRSQLLFEKLVPSLNRIRTMFPLYINLIANCDSYGIKDFLHLGPNIDEFWVVTENTRSVSKAMLAAKDNGDSDIFLERNEADDDCLYVKYVGGKLVKECDDDPGYL